jgi:hypothetical protein
MIPVFGVIRPERLVAKLFAALRVDYSVPDAKGAALAASAVVWRDVYHEAGLYLGSSVHAGCFMEAQDPVAGSPCTPCRDVNLG